MKIVAAIDSFKGSLSSLEAGEAVKEAFRLSKMEGEVKVCPLADGGEGTVEALTLFLGGTFEKVLVTGPLLVKTDCVYGRAGDLAIIEMAGAAGITLVSDAERNPLNTTTYGVGEVIKDALDQGIRRFIIGIGGSATNDGGVGMLQALGFEFLDRSGKEIAFGAKGLEALSEIRTDHADKRLADCEFQIACDVTNPLCGEKGCSAVYGPQKGATPEMIKEMDGWLKNYADLSKKVYENADMEYPGSGAAGGMGFAFRTYLNGILKSGIQIVLEETKLAESIKDADLVITGEGRLDSQTVMGKAPAGVAELAKKYKKPVIAFSGCVTKDATACNEHGIDAFFPVLRRIETLEEALKKENARENLIDTAEQVFRLIKTFR